MLYLPDRHGQTSEEKPVAGEYDSVVVDVRWAEGYGFEEAYEIVYEITSKTGKVYRHREIFMNNVKNKRTRDFENYLLQNGITSLSGFQGCKEKLTFIYQKVGNREYFNIADREFLV